MAKPKKKISVPEVSVLGKEGWLPERVSVLKLVPGDIVYVQGKTIEIKAVPFLREDGKIELPANLYEPPIHLMLGEVDKSIKHIVNAADLVGSSVHNFEDGTSMITEIEHGPDYVYSPRLPTAELNKFCKENMEEYRKFNDDHGMGIYDGEYCIMEPFWLVGEVSRG